MKNQKGISLIKLIILVIVVGVALVYGVAFLLFLNYDFPEPEPSKYEKIYNIGDTITTKNFEVTITNIEEKTRVGSLQTYKKVDDYYYTLICVTAELKNISNETQRLIDYRPDYSIYLKLEDDREKIYYNDSTYTEYYQLELDNIVNTQTISPNTTGTVAIVFKVDKYNYENRTFYLNIWGDTALIKIN